MNLLNDPWMPVRNAQGERHWITPDRLSEPQWLAFDADRPDFNGALAQFAIGLLQTTTPVADSIDWRGLFNAPPDAAELRRWFGPVAFAFELDGDGARFMQDADLGAVGVADNDIGALLIESPGANTLKNNTDHFVKRGQMLALCQACAATALFTLQLNAPSGGQGHLTGMRGEGPLTTLVLGPPGSPLWHDLWMNVKDRLAFSSQGGDAEKIGPHFSFPWLEPINALQAEKGELAPIQVHPAHVFWTMPRRIRLDGNSLASGLCACCGRCCDRLLTRFSKKTHGLNYKDKGAWNHPLSPYYETKKGWLPSHPQPDGLGYRHWLGWVLGVAGDNSSRRPASVVERALSLSHRQTGGQLRLWAFGFDMDSMKARCWYEATVPLYGLADCDPMGRQRVQAEVSLWLAAAEMASGCLRGAVKDAWFGASASADVTKKLGHVEATFWSATEPSFYRHLQSLINAARGEGEHADLPAREAWHATLIRDAVRLFDHAFVGTGAVERQNPRRAALAYRQLHRNLHGPKMRQALGLPTDEPRTKPARKATRRPAKEAT